MRTRAQSSDAARAVSMSSLPEDMLYHILKFVDENDDARCRAISQSWANLRRVWVVRGRGIEPRVGDHEHVTFVAFSHDGTLLAVGASDYDTNNNCSNYNISVHNVATGDSLHILPRLPKRAYCAAFSPIDSAVLVVGDEFPKITVHNLATGHSSILQSFPYSRAFSVNTVTYSPDAAKLAVCRYKELTVIGIDGLTKVGQTRIISTTTAGDTVWLHGAAFSAAGAVLSVAAGSKIRCYDVASGELRREIEHGFEIWTLTGSSSGLVLAGGHHGTLALYDASTGHLRRELRSESPGGNNITSSCFSPDSSAFAAQNSDPSGYKTIAIYDVETCELRREITRRMHICAIAFTPDGKAIALGDYDGRVALYDATTGDRRRMQRQPQAPPAAPEA